MAVPASSRTCRRAGRRRAALEPLDPGQQRGRRRVDLGCRRLDQDQLELDPGLSAVGGGLERPGDQVEQPDGVGLEQRLRLFGQAAVALGRDPQLGRDLAEDLHGQQLARVNLEVAEHLTGIAS